MKKVLFFALMILSFAGFALADTPTQTQTITPTVTSTVTPTQTPYANVTQTASKFGDIVTVTELKQSIKVAASSGLLYALYPQENGNTAVSRSLVLTDGAGNTVFSRSWTVGQSLPYAIFEAVTYKGAAPPAVSALPYVTSLSVKTDFNVKVIKK